MSIPANVQTELLQIIGDQDAETFLPFLESIWDCRNDKSVIGGIQLQIAYCKRDVVERLLGQLWQSVRNARGDEKSELKDRYDNVQAIYANNNVEIIRLEQIINASRGPVVGQPTATAPVMPFVRAGYVIDPNARRYRGDPIFDSVIVQEDL